MTDSDAPKPAKASTKSSDNSDTGQPSSEAGAADAENNLREPTEGPDAISSEQAAVDMMAALCRDFGLPGFEQATSGNPAQPSQQQQPMETAFQIIQRYLLDGGTSSPTSSAPTEGYTGPLENMDPWYSTDSGSAATNPPGNTADAQWGVTTIHADGSTTDMTGPVIRDDMFRTAMPTLQGKADTTADTPDWAISMEQGYPLSPTKTSAQTAISAKMLAPDVPKSLCKWSLHVGASTDAQSELSVTAPNAAPSQLRALLFDAIDANGAAPQMSEVPIYGGAPHAIHLEQTVGATGSEATPDVALIRLIFADRAPVPIHLEYVGTLPSPIVAGNVMVAPNSSIPFWVQITPPSEGDKGAGLVVLVRYEAETSFDVTAQLMTQARTSTPTAILSCNAQHDQSACRAASMISDSRGRLETGLTGLPTDPDAADLEKYGFIPPAFMLDADTSAPTPAAASTAATAKAAPTPTPAKSGAAAKTSDPGDDGETDSSDSSKTSSSNAKSSSGASKGKNGNSDNSDNSDNSGSTGSSKGGT
ncbi:MULTISPECIES: hypothetical protein [unclassified Thalassospira]|uniref:hypothetical protein n=1 Tax=unclassified Thalassospira TaxID=2648997 RepID=UPI0007A6303E|nr:MULTISPECIES: hypothetical protein [unclassified Thalassospira]KZC99877.1 hypothetical protein AUQ41_09465 [Thalassospira sp. MCCC 1A02898]ONH86121.1 hypothetical protein TH47_18245 [Thalassospira sp. MCCC 1A02803]